MHRRRAEKIVGLIAERPRTAYEIAQELWGNVAVTQAFLTLSEVVGHVDLLIDAGLVREVADGDVVRFEATGRGRRGYDPAVSAADRRTTTVSRRAPRRPRTAAARPRARRKKRMLIIVNPYATTVSDRLKNLVVYALQGRYEVEAVSTEAQNHAIEIGREARDGGYDIVVAFGGDGTLNEVANGLAGTDVPVSVLPGGSTNVVSRTLGIPNDVVDATEHLLGLADDFEPRKIDLGIANGRRFVFACGVGPRRDRGEARRPAARSSRPARGPYFYTWAAVSAFYRQYLRNPVRMRLETGGRAGRGGHRRSPRTPTRSPTSAAARCASARAIEIDDGTLSVAMLRRAAQRDMATDHRPGAASSACAPSGHRQIDHFDDVTEAPRRVGLHRRRGRRRGRSRSRSTATTSATTPSSSSAIEPGALTVVA